MSPRDTLGAIVDHCARQLGGTFLAPGSTLSVASLVVTLGVAATFIAARRRGRRLRPAVLLRALFPRRMVRSRSGRLDLGFFLFSTLFAGLAIGWALVSADAVRATLHHLSGVRAPTRLPGPLGQVAATLILFLAYEFAYWLDHMLKHRVAWLWAFHKVHHSAESLSLLTIFRVHPVDTILFYNLVAVTTGLAATLVELTTGARADLFAIGGTSVLTLLSAVLLTHLQHSHLWIVPPGGWLLGPAHHQLHHSADPAHHNRNYGNALTLFDRLFGTLLAPAATRGPLRFGIGATAHDAHSLRGAFVEPFVDAAHSVVRPRGRERGMPPITRCS